MCPSRRHRCLLIGMIVGLAMLQAPSALASSGAITNVHDISGGKVEATYTATVDTCTSSGYCGWFAEAWQVAATETCAAQGSHPVYVGDSQSTSGTQTETDSFYPAYAGAIKLCLYYLQAGTWTFLAETTFTPGSSTPTTPSGPGGSATPGSASGAITDAHSVDGGKAQATFSTLVGACPSSGSCAWYAKAFQVPAAEPCPANPAALTKFAFVGESHAAAGSETETETFPPVYAPAQTRLCLYVNLGGATTLIAETVFKPTPTGSASGSIDNVHSLASGKVEATFSLDVSLCRADRTCSWSGRAYELPAAKRCSPSEGEWVWLGSYHSRAGSQTKTVSFTPDRIGRIRLCLYVRQSHSYRLLDQTLYTVPKPKPFSLTRARRAVDEALRVRFGASFLGGTSYRRTCQRISAKRVRCSVFWAHGSDTYNGSVTVWVDRLPWTHIHYLIRVVKRYPL